MTAATEPRQRPASARLLVVDARGRLTHAPRASFVDFLKPGDLVVANDAATLPASLHGVHEATGASIEVRLAAWTSLASRAVASATAVVFGGGDSRTPTEQRELPPPLVPPDRLLLGPLVAIVRRVLSHPRCVAIEFEGTPDAIWAGIARHGRPIQYAHMATPLELWDVWTVIAGQPAAFEPPSAGFVLDWRTLATFRARHVEFVTLTHAAGISSTGDESLDRQLPFDEPYDIPASTAAAINRASAERRRVVAVGTTVVRALEHAATDGGTVPPGPGLANQRITSASPLRIVDVVLSGVHEPTTSHYQLLRAFTDDATLRCANEAMDASGFLTHEFGDSVLIERSVSIPKTSAGFLPDRSFSSARASTAHAL